MSIRKVPYEDQELLQCLKNGDEAAFDQVYNAYFQRLRYFSFQLVKEMRVAEDIAVDSFVKLLQRSPNFATTDQIRGFLFTLVKNASLDHLKTAQRHRASHEEIRYLGGVQEDAELALVRAEALELIYQQIEQLPPQCRQIVRLIFIEGKTVKEVALALNLAEQTVLNQKSRGVQLIKNALIRDQLLSPLLWYTLLDWLRHL